MVAKRFTHFHDRTDGRGGYRDTDKVRTALRWHREAVAREGTDRSWIYEYDRESGERVATIANWSREGVEA
jgi:hypothetical protein